MHLDVESLQRLLHGELSATASTKARTHLQGCDSCMQRYRQSANEEDLILARLRLLDVPSPVVTVDAIRQRGRRPVLRRARWAAAALALFATSLLYAAPKSVLRSVIERAAVWFQVDRPEQERTLPPLASTSMAVTMIPADSFAISFSSTQSAGTIYVVFANQDLLSIGSPGAVVPMDVKIDQVIVRNDRSTNDYDIIIPRRTRIVVVSIQGRVVWTKRQRDILRAKPSDSRGYQISLQKN